MNISRSFWNILIVFFFWGFLAASNGIFIPFCKSHFALNQFQSQLIDFSFYGAYFMGSILVFFYSLVSQKDLFLTLGYRYGIIYGILLSAFGCLLMITSIYIDYFPLILISFFIIALGFSFQQTAANPLVILMGDPTKGSHRLNLAGGINSLGTTLGPLVLSKFLFGTASGSIAKLYMGLLSIFLLSALILYKSSIKEPVTTENTFKNKVIRVPFLIMLGFLGVIGMVFLYYGSVLRTTHYTASIILFSMALFVFSLLLFFILKYKQLEKKQLIETKNIPQLNLGMMAIFAYVGAEVTIQSNLGAFLNTPEFNFTTGAILSKYISLYWGSLMIGRWVGSLANFKLNKGLKVPIMLGVLLVGFMVILGTNVLNGNGVIEIARIYPVFLFILFLGFLFSKEKPAYNLQVFSLLGSFSLILGLITTGTISLFLFVSAGLYCSIMWPCIFSMAIANLKAYTGQGSSYLIMMILGGALLPPIQGLICDLNLHFASPIKGYSWSHISYLIPFLCFLYLTYFSYYTNKLLLKQGLNYN